MTTAGAASLEDVSTVGGLHSDAETMRRLLVADIGLVRSLHGKTCLRVRLAFKYTRAGSKIGTVVGIPESVEGV